MFVLFNKWSYNNGLKVYKLRVIENVLVEGGGGYFWNYLVSRFKFLSNFFYDLNFYFSYFDVFY